MPKVSVIIPNYNHQKYLKERLDSVLHQSYQDIEVIILDDCSTDQSREIIESYRRNSKVIHIVYNEQNSGSTFLQWKKGLSLARGEYVWIAESDDWAELDFLNDTIKLLDAHKEVSLVSTNINYVDSDGQVFQAGYRYPSYKNIRGAEKIYAGNKFILKHMIEFNVISNASAVLFRTSVGNKAIDTIIKYRLCGDWMFWMMLSINNNIILTRKVYNNFRCHIHSVRSQTSQENLLKEQFQVINETLNILKVSGFDRFWLYQRLFTHIVEIEGIKARYLKDKELFLEDRFIEFRIFHNDFKKMLARVFYHFPRKIYFFCKAIVLKIIRK